MSQIKSFTITNTDQAVDVLGWIVDALNRGEIHACFSREPMKCQEHKARTSKQNDMKERQVHVVAKQLYGGDEAHTRNELKYRCGTPILCRDDPEFMDFCTLALSGLDYEQRIKAMEFVPVTSRMSTKQLSEYVDKVFSMYAEQVDWAEADAASSF